MAYCVHCGVRLGEAEACCPLCGTVAEDPKSPRDPDAPKPFPVRAPEQTIKMSRRYAVSLLSLLLLPPAGACLLLDWLSGSVSWSVYPAGVLALLWIVFTVPLLLHKYRVYSTLLITCAALVLYLYVVERLVGSPGWFLPVVLPSLLLLMGMLCFCVALVRKWKTPGLRVAVAALIQAGLLALTVEALCVYQGMGLPFLAWSPYVVAPLFFVAALLYAVSRNRPLCEELKRRLHF